MAQQGKKPVGWHNSLNRVKSEICFGENLMGCELEKTKVTMNKPVYLRQAILEKTKVTMNKPENLRQAILDLSKLVMYEFHYDHMIPKYKENLKLCYMDTDSLVYHIKTEDFYSDIAGDVEARFDIGGFTEPRPLPVGLNRKVIGLMKDELGGKIMKEFVAL